MIDWKNIIIHHSAGKDGFPLETTEIRIAHKQRGWSDIGYHYLIELANKSYEIIVGRMLDKSGAHCIGRNSDSIGICVVGNYEISFPHRQQYELLIKLCKSLCYQFNIPPAHIYPHKKFKNTLCPGKNLDVDHIVQEVTKSTIANHAQ